MERESEKFVGTVGLGCDSFSPPIRFIMRLGLLWKKKKTWEVRGSLHTRSSVGETVWSREGATGGKIISAKLRQMFEEGGVTGGGGTISSGHQISKYMGLVRS
jgi:hypothetical protein